MPEPSTTAAGDGRPRCLLTSVMWGDWHTGMFLDANLPTLLAPGNLPAFAAGVDLDYFVYTTPDDAARMGAHPAFQRLRQVADVQLRTFTPSSTANPIGLHHTVWNEAIDHARNRRSFIVLMPPDVVWADGSFARLGEALRAGKQAIFMTYPRVTSETLVPSMLERFRPDASGAVVVSPPDMMKLALTHIHPLMAAYMRSGSHFPIHPEMVIWPVEGDGFLLRLTARELFCFEPGRFDLNAVALLAQIPSPDRFHLFQDSLEFLGLSLTPLWKDMEWYLRPNRLDPLFVGRWWVNYDSPLNDHLSGLDLRFRCGRADEATWRRAGQAADALVTHLKSAREFVRLVIALNEAGCVRAAEFIASALRVHGIARRWPHRGPFMIFVPGDAALRKLLDRLPDANPSRDDVLRLLRWHVALVPPNREFRDGEIVETIGGARFRLRFATDVKWCGANRFAVSNDGPLDEDRDGAHRRSTTVVASPVGVDYGGGTARAAA